MRKIAKIFAVESGSFLELSAAEGIQFGNTDAENPIILDDDFKSEGIKAGDIVLDSSTGMEFTIIGFTKDQMCGHTSVGFITTDTYHELRTLLNPLYEQACHAGNVKNAIQTTVIFQTKPFRLWKRVELMFLQR